jgi:hypothetical protein
VSSLQERQKPNLAIYYGFSTGQRVTAGSPALGTVTLPDYEPDDEVVERRCVPVVMDEDMKTGAISWFYATSLQKQPPYL